MEKIQTTSNGGALELYGFDDVSVTISRGGGPSRSYELALVRRVRLASMGSMRICELGLSNGVQVALSTERPTAEFTAFIEALHRKLMGHQPVEFVRGSWLLVAVNAAIGVLAVLTGLALHFGWIAPPEFMRAKAMSVVTVGFVWAVIGPFLVWRSRHQSYLPTASALYTR